MTDRFKRFHNNVLLTTRQRDDGFTKARGVVSCLSARYYGGSPQSDHAFLGGSWGKETQTRPPRDVDVFFKLPSQVYARLQGHRWNRQSALLQEVKDALIGTYPSTVMRGDGQVVVVTFDSYSVDVVPAFKLTNGGYWICDTRDGGSYTETHPHEEAAHLEAVDADCGRNLRPLIRMAKTWQAYCNVPIKSFHLELVAAQFLSQWKWRLESWFFFDWMMRDFFGYLRQQYVVRVPGGAELVLLGDDWRSRAETAHERSRRACEYEGDNLVLSAGDEWQKIFGDDIPRSV